MNNVNKNFYTVYFLNGEREVLHGESIEDAFNKRGYGAAVTKLMDWYDEGVTDTHNYSSDKKWVKKKLVELVPSDITEELIIKPALLTSSGIQVTFSNGDILTIAKEIGKYAVIGWVESIHIYYGEYHHGTYAGDTDDELNQHHFMVTGGQHFPPDAINEAIDIFKQRVISPQPWKSIQSKSGKQLSEIAETQQ